jgi:hypothetical protein
MLHLYFCRPVVAILALYSYWVPQILHSTYSGTKHSLHPVYLVGTSLARCFVPLYILGCPNNFLTLLTIYVNPQYLAVLSDAAVRGAATGAPDLQDLSTSSVSACWVLVLWQAVQVGVLLLQGSLGPRFFVPKQWLPQRYDYHRTIPATVRAALTAHSSTAPAPTAVTTAPDSGNRDTSGDIAMTGMRSRASTSSRSPVIGNLAAGATAPASGSGVGGGLFAMLFGVRAGAGTGAVNREDHDADMLETGSLLSSYNRDRESREGNAARTPTATGTGVNTAAAISASDVSSSGSHDAECVICYNAIHLTAGDYMVSVTAVVVRAMLYCFSTRCDMNTSTCSL